MKSRTGRSIRRSAILAAAALAICGAAPSHADTQAVFFLGDAAPGTGGGIFTAFDAAPSLNDDGQFAFRAFLQGTTNASGQGIFCGSTTSLTCITRDKQAAPGIVGGVFAGFGVPSLSSLGQVAFYGSADTADGNVRGIFRGDNTSLTCIIRDQQAAPRPRRRDPLRLRRPEPEQPRPNCVLRRSRKHHRRHHRRRLPWRQHSPDLHRTQHAGRARHRRNVRLVRRPSSQWRWPSRVHGCPQRHPGR